MLRIFLVTRVCVKLGASIDQTRASAQSYPRPNALRQNAPLATDATWIGAGPERYKPVAEKL